MPRKPKVNVFEVVERDKYASDKAHAAIEAANERAEVMDKRLGKSRGIFWTIVGNPPAEPILSAISRRIDGWSPYRLFWTQFGAIMAFAAFAIWIIQAMMMYLVGAGLLAIAILLIFRSGIDEEKFYQRWRKHRQAERMGGIAPV